MIFMSMQRFGVLVKWQGGFHISQLHNHKKILEKFIEGNKTFAIVYKNNNKVIGSIGIEELRNINEEQFKKIKGRELGFVLSKEYWGLGIMPEAVKKVIGYLFNDCNLDFITCSAFY